MTFGIREIETGGAEEESVIGRLKIRGMHPRRCSETCDCVAAFEMSGDLSHWCRTKKMDRGFRSALF